jgi:hypothetical protein
MGRVVDSNGIDGYPAAKINEQVCRHLTRLYSNKRGMSFDERFAPIIFGYSRDAVISARVYQSQSVTEEMGRKMHAHLGSRCHLRPSIFKLTSL